MRIGVWFGFYSVLFVSAADQRSGVCVTPQETLCRTIRLESSGWENRSWGFHAIERFQGSATFSYRRDGAWLERSAQRSFKNYVVPNANWDLARIKLSGQNETIEIDHTNRQYKIRPGVFGGLTVWDPNDRDCAKYAAAFSLSDLRRTGEVMIAGIRSIEYTGMRSSTHRVTVALAPSLGCTQMRKIDHDYNRVGLPTLFYRVEVVSVQIGEPDPALFQIPTGYRPVGKR